MLRRALATAGRRSFSSKICSDVTQAIGATPMVQLNRIIGPHMKAKRVLAKLEMQNPGGSVKDRIAKDMIEKAEARGEISPGKTTIVEVTSGNTGIGLAMVCAAKGYKCVIIMPQLPPMAERYLICRKFGAHVHLTAGAPGAPMFDNMNSHLADMPRRPEQLVPVAVCQRRQSGGARRRRHRRRDLGADGRRRRLLRRGRRHGRHDGGRRRVPASKNPPYYLAAVEPEESRVLTGAPSDKHGGGHRRGHPAQVYRGARAGRAVVRRAARPRNEFAYCASPEANVWSNRLAAEERGCSSAVDGRRVQKVAADVACRPEAAGKTVVVFPSSGIRYVMHPMWAELKAEAAEPLAPAADFRTSRRSCGGSRRTTCRRRRRECSFQIIYRRSHR